MSWKVPPGPAALGLACLGALGPAWPAPAAELPGAAAARIEQAAAVTAGEGAELSFDAAGEGTLADSFTVTAAPYTAVSFTFAAASATGADAGGGPGNFAHDAGPTPATDAAGRLTVRVAADLPAAPGAQAGDFPGAFPGAFPGVFRAGYLVIVNY
ncbi:MAG: hypothetical protein ACFCUW_18285 [Kiloniellaceae bacterium]